MDYKVAYLAPEIPALSATFVYKEIQTLEENGLRIIPFSIHRPANEASDPSLASMKSKVVYVYDADKLTVFGHHLTLLVKRPLHYASTLMMLFSDIVELGLFSRSAIAMLYRFFYAARVAYFLKKHHCEHLHVHFAHVPTDVAMYASRLVDIPYSVTAHANDLFERGWLLKKKVARSKFFATISEFNKHFLADQGINVDLVKIVRCGVDESQFSPRAVTKPNTIFRIGLVARLVEKKGIDTLIKAVNRLVQQGRTVELIVGGSGPLEESLKELSETLDLPRKSVQFIGAMPHTEVVDFIKTLDAFVLPCKKDKNGDMDGIPVVLMEAMLSAVPVISGRISGIPELIIDQETGLLVEPGDDEALSAAVIELMDNATLRNRLLTNAVDKVRQEFSISNNTKYLQKLFIQ